MTTLSKEDVVRMAESLGWSLDAIEVDDMFAFATLARADLVAENKRLKEENTAFRKAWNADQIFVELRTALAAAEADNERLRVALEYKHDSVDALMAWCVKNVDKWHFSQYDNVAYAIEKMRSAICQPRDDSALREMIAVVYEECASWYAKEGWLLDEDDVPGAIRALAEKARHGS